MPGATSGRPRSARIEHDRTRSRRESTLRPWTDHLPSGNRLTPGDLVSSGTLLRSWSQRWQAEPDARLWWEPDRTGSASPGGAWWGGRGGAAEGLGAAPRRAAGRLRGAGLRPGDRVVWSTGSSIDAVVAHVGALRAGLVVVPSNRSEEHTSE